MERRQLYILITIVITLCLLTGCGTAANSEIVPMQFDEAGLNETKIEAKKLFAQREDLSKLREALALLEKLRNPAKRNYELEWTFAKYSYFLGKHTIDEAEA